MQNVMKKAWEIARNGQNKFGGKVKEYFAQALKIAWSIVKNAMNNYATQVKGIVTKFEVVKLEGAPKQIAWAEQIRGTALRAMLDEVITEEYEVQSSLPHGKPKMERRSVRSLLNALASRETIEAYFEDMEKQNVHESQYASTVKSFNGVLDRYARLVEIIENPSAKFWIDNRDNQEQNHMFHAFKKYVATGVKNF